MNRILLKCIFIILNLLHFTCYAVDELEKEIQDAAPIKLEASTFDWLAPSKDNKQPIAIESILSVAEEALRISREHNVPPSRISIVFDLDGTLTQCRDPKTYKGPAQANDAVNEILQFLIEQKFQIVISSAWHIFEESLKRLRELDLSHLIEGRVEEGKLIVNHGGFLGEKPTEFKYLKLGHAVSVKNVAKSSALNPYYLAKAMAAYAVNPEHAKEIELILFVDDNPRNTKSFINDLKQYPIYKNLGDYIAYLIEGPVFKRDEERIAYVKDHLYKELQRHQELQKQNDVNHKQLGALRELRLSMKKSFDDLPEFRPECEDVENRGIPSCFTSSWYNTKGSETPLSSSPIGQNDFLNLANSGLLKHSQEAIAPGVPAKIQSGHATPKSPLSHSLNEQDFEDQTFRQLFGENLALSDSGNIEG